MLLLNRLSLFGVVLATVLAGLCTVDAAKGPKVTHKVYFDIKQGDKDLGRGKLTRGTPWYIVFILFPIQSNNRAVRWRMIVINFLSACELKFLV